VLADSPATLNPLISAEIADDHPNTPKQFGIRLSQDTMELVSTIQEFRQRTNQPASLAAIVEPDTRCPAATALRDRRAGQVPGTRAPSNRR
jgi:hypothetical protein